MADALVIGLAKKVKRGGKSSADEEPADDEGEGDDKEMSLDEAEDSAVDDLLSAIDEGDKGAAKTALRDFVKACVKRLEKGDY